MINEIKDSSWTSGKLVRCTGEEEALVRLGRISICSDDVDGFFLPIGCNHRPDIVCYYYYDAPIKINQQVVTGLWRWEPNKHD